MTSSISIIQRSTCVATFFQPSQRFTGEKLFKFVCPIDWWTLHGSSSNRSPMQHSTYPTIFWKPHDVASKLPLLRSAGFSFSPRFHMAYLNHFSHTLVPKYVEFRAMDPASKSRLELQPRIGSYVLSGYQLSSYQQHRCTGAQLQNKQLVSRWHRKF